MIDLHMHSSYSEDGQFSPRELAEKCAAKEISVMSVTDHNCACANAEARKAAEEKHITYITGIEIDCTFGNTNFHMLGYGIDCTSPDFKDIENHVRSQGRDASLRMLQKTRALGFSVTEESLEALCKDGYWPEIWTGEMFAEVLLADPRYADHPLLKPYRPGGTRSNNPCVNFYWDFYSCTKPCHAGIRYPRMEDIVDLIHQNHGFAVLAHPAMNLDIRSKLLSEIMELPIDGIEAFSSYHSPNQAFNLYQSARRRRIFTTCGSDFHGRTKPSVELGKHGCLLTEDAMLDQLQSLLEPEKIRNSEKYRIY